MSVGLDGQPRSRWNHVDHQVHFTIMTHILALIGFLVGSRFGLVMVVIGGVLGMILGFVIAHVLVNYSRKRAGMPPLPFWQ